MYRNKLVCFHKPIIVTDINKDAGSLRTNFFTTVKSFKRQTNGAYSIKTLLIRNVRTP
jgi:hypothetical protein